MSHLILERLFSCNFFTEEGVATLFCLDFREVDVVLSPAKVRFFFNLRAS